MAKDFLAYDQQVDKLVNEKGLVVSDRAYVIEARELLALMGFPEDWID